MLFSIGTFLETKLTEILKIFVVPRGQFLRPAKFSVLSRLVSLFLAFGIARPMSQVEPQSRLGLSYLIWKSKIAVSSPEKRGVLQWSE